VRFAEQGADHATRVKMFSGRELCKVVVINEKVTVPVHEHSVRRMLGPPLRCSRKGISVRHRNGDFGGHLYLLCIDETWRLV
jgi:hypothetical protein